MLRKQSVGCTLSLKSLNCTRLQVHQIQGLGFTQFRSLGNRLCYRFGRVLGFRETLNPKPCGCGCFKVGFEGRRVGIRTDDAPGF